SYLGVVSLVRIKNGELKKGDKIKIMSSGRDFLVDHVGIFKPKKSFKDTLKTGEVGFMVAGIKAIDGAPVGDTITHVKNPALTALPGFTKVQPKVFAGLFPVSSDDFEAFREALAKL